MTSLEVGILTPMIMSALTLLQERSGLFSQKIINMINRQNMILMASASNLEGGILTQMITYVLSNSPNCKDQIGTSSALVDSAPGHQETPKPPSGGFLFEPLGNISMLKM
ncbi:hypothetical protein G6658_08540 [Polynucleobacter paneuropaeus]|nr:hypothetical protein G6658_08540 [Polynucleobacter paneuropaeus]